MTVDPSAGRPPTRLTSHEARERLRDQIGSFELVAAELTPLLRERTKGVILRDPGEKAAQGNARELARRVFDRWAEAGGLVPKLRRQLPQTSWNVTLEPDEFVEEWNERWWWHKPAGRGEMTVDEYFAGPLMTGRDFVDWCVEWWAYELHEETRLNPIEAGCMPLVLLVFTGAWTFNALPWWLAVPAAAAITTAVMWPFTWLRRRLYLRFGDD